MRKKFTMLLALVLCVLSSSVMAQTTYYRPGARTTTLEVGKKYFISAATFYNNARPNLLYNDNGKLAYSDKKPNALINDASYLFTVVKIGANNIYYITNSDGKYLQANTLDSDAAEKGVTIVPYSKAKGGIACGSDVQACDESGNKIEYNNITDDTPIVCVYHNNSTGWRHINGLQTGKATPFAFYEVEEVFPEITTDESNPKWYTIKNVRGNAYAYYNGTGTAMGMSGRVDKAAYLFYFTAGETEGTYKIHNYVNSMLCAAPDSWTEKGIDWHIRISGSTAHPGLAISKEATLTAEGSEAWNDYQNNHTSVNWYGGNDDGSTWQISRYEFESILPTVQLSTDDNIVLHYIQSQRRTNFVNFDGHNKTFKEGDKGLSSYWYFVQDEEAQKNAPAGFVACRIYNAAYATGVENHSSGYMGDASWPARVYYIGTGEYERNGYLIYRADANLENNGYGCWHDKAGGEIMDYHKNDAGSYWRIYPSETTSADLMQQAEVAKTNVMNMISGMYEYADYYTYTDEAIAVAKNAIDAVNIGNISGAVQSLINSPFESILTTLKETQKSAAPAAGDYIQLKNKEHKKYLKAFDNHAEGADDMSDHATVWYVEAGEGGNFKLRNLATKKYVGHIRKSATTAMQEDVANAAQFSWSNQEDIYAAFKDVDVTGVAEGDVNHVYGHVNGGNLVGWVADAGSSQWAVAKISAEPYLQALQEEIARATVFVGTAVGQKTVANAESFESKKSAAQALVDNASTDILALHHTKLELAAMVDAGTPNLPVAGKYYQIKSANPDFYKKQGKEMAIYSSDNEGRLAWKALDSSNKAFYWTITPKDGKFILKNEADGKYVPAVSEDKYMMTATETEAATFTLTWLTVNQFNIAGNGTMHMMGHGSGAGTGDRICSWNGGINSSSAWTIVEVEHPDLAAAKTALKNKIDELNLYIANATGKIGYYQAVDTDELEAAVAEAEVVLNGGGTKVDTYNTAATTLSTVIAGLDKTIVLPSKGKFYRFKKPAADAYMLSDVYVHNGKNMLAMGAKKGGTKGQNEITSIFYYGKDGTILSYALGRYLSEANDAISSDWTCKPVGTENPPTAKFGAGSKLGTVGFYMGDNNNRAYYSGHGNRVDAGGTFGSNAGYDWEIEVVEYLPVKMNTTYGYATVCSPVALSTYKWNSTSAHRVEAYIGEINIVGDNTWLHLERVDDGDGIIPANTPVVLKYLAEIDANTGYVFLKIVESDKTLDNNVKNDIKGKLATAVNDKKEAANCYYTLQPNEKGDGVVFKGFIGDNLKGFSAYLELPDDAPTGAINIRFEGTTDIEHSEIRNQHSEMIFDLLGRRVEAITKGGIYIVNGKKVVVK